MDENKFDPTLGNTEEENKAEEVVVPESAAECTQVVAEEITEAVSDETEDETAEETTQDDDDEETTADEDVVCEQTVVEQQPKKKKKVGKIIVLSILGVILAAIIAFFAVYAAKTNIDADKTVLSVGDVDSNVGEFLNVYSAYQYYASYYGFSEDDVKGYAIDELVAVNSYYVKAVEEGYTLSEEDIAEIEANIDSINASAEAYSTTADEYIADNICKGYTMEQFRAYLEKQYLAQKYYSENLDKITAEYEDGKGADEIQAKYEDERVTYDLSDVLYWYFDSTDETAEDNADAIVDKVKDGMDFADAVAEVTGDTDSEPKSIKGHTKSVVTANFSADAADWIFETKDDEYENGTGAVTTLEADSMIYVLYVVNAPARDESIPVTVNYIKVDVSTDTTVKSEDELQLSAKATATKIFGEFESSDKTADEFTALMNTYSAGSDTLVTVNAFSEIVPGSVGDDAVESWIFAEDRKVNDYALVEGDGCYYILFYTAVNDYAVWYQTALDAILEERYADWDAQIKDEFEDKTVVYDDVIAEVLEYLSLVG